MSVFVETKFGRFRRVKRDGEVAYLFECPGCGVWAALDDDQMRGKVSVNHEVDGCKGRYHETHNFLDEIDRNSHWATA